MTFVFFCVNSKLYNGVLSFFTYHAADVGVDVAAIVLIGRKNIISAYQK